MKKIICLIGYKQSGKSTTLKFLQERIMAKEIMLANHLKDVCSSVWYIPRRYFDDQNFKELTFKEIRLLEFTSIYQKRTYLSLICLISFIACHFLSWFLVALFLPLILVCYRVYINNSEDSVKFDEIILSKERLLKASKMFDLEPTSEVLYGLIGRTIKTPRELAQIIGSDYLRAIDDNCHIKIAVKKAEGDGPFVVSDVRFPNEFNYFRDEGAFMVHIDRKQASPKDGEAVHSSESHIKDLGKKCDLIINNNSTFSQLHSQLNLIPPLLISHMCKKDVSN